MPATKVPCPRPSPAAFGKRLVMPTCVTNRPPRPATEALTPESTTAIVGGSVARVERVSQTWSRPAAYGHCSRFQKPETDTGAMSPVAGEVAAAVAASGLTADTATCSVDPMSTEPAVYVSPVAPPMSAHCTPLGSHLCH